MSPSLVPKPADWKGHIGDLVFPPCEKVLKSFFVDVVGFYFLDLASDYRPSDELAAFLAAGPPPVYIGFGSLSPHHLCLIRKLFNRFGSIVVDDSKTMTSWIPRRLLFFLTYLSDL
jgi:hypothetical protein